MAATWHAAVTICLYVRRIGMPKQAMHCAMHGMRPVLLADLVAVFKPQAYLHVLDRFRT
jgi:hypothetical protein